MIEAARLTATTLTATHVLFHRGLDGLTHEQLMAQPHGADNPLFWIGGHMAQVRAQFCMIFGTRIEFPWAGFKRGDARSDPATWPEFAEVVRVYDQSHAAMLTGLETITPEWLAEPKGRYPGVSDDRYGTLALMGLHESYHCGQISQIRRALGLSGLAG